MANLSNCSICSGRRYAMSTRASTRDVRICVHSSRRFCSNDAIWRYTRVRTRLVCAEGSM
eukprot:1322904-Amorphochlora_amoeboformis.AAC.1